MKVYMAAFCATGKAVLPEPTNSPHEDYLYKIKPNYVLDSYYEMRNLGKDKRERFLRYVKSSECKDFMLDSGAFTFMESTDKRTSFDEYLKGYGNFIQKYDINRFFELDVDSVVGVKKVREMRERLEQRTGKKCIPVWHKQRGKEGFLKLVNEYEYIAIGGIVSGEFKKDEYKFFHWFIRIAHENNTKIHGLGFTNPGAIKEYNWDSVDSTSWTQGGRWGNVVKFDGKTLRKKEGPQNKRVKDYRRLTMHNLKQWKQFAKYLDNGSTQKPAKQTKTIEE